MTGSSPSFARVIGRVVGHLPRRRRWQASGLLGLTIAGALAELVTLGAILPFLALVADPAVLDGSLVSRWAASLGGPGVSSTLTMLALLFCAAAVVSAAIRLLLNWSTQQFVYRLGADIGRMVYERTLYQPYAQHISQNTNEVISGINKIPWMVTDVLMPIIAGASSVLILLALFGGLMLIDAPIAIASGIFLAVVYFCVSLVTRRRLRRNGDTIADTQTRRLQALREGLGGIRDVIIDHSQPIFLEKFADIDATMRRSQASNAFMGSAPRYIVETAGTVMIVTVVVILSGREGGIMASLPVIGALALGAQRLLPLMQQIYSGWTQVHAGRQLSMDILALLDRPTAPQSRAVPKVAFEQSISLEDVGFRYPVGGLPVLRGISLKIPKGARVGFIGRTGSGKTTLIDLVMGLLEPSEGVIRIDGQVLDGDRLGGWQAQITHVPQHIYLSDASVIDNIAYGVASDAVDLDQVREAAWKADIGAFIEAHPDGYHARVGERGIQLSSGQRQRVGIARALYKRSALLVLDEATSALDSETEETVMRALDGLDRDLTILVVAHRHSTLRGCDVIFRLERGRIVGSGPYAAMIPQTRAAAG